MSDESPRNSKTQSEEREGEMTINRGRLGSITIYEITDDELEAILKGKGDSVFLNFAIFLLSTSISLIIVLITTPIPSEVTRIVFIVSSIVGAVAGMMLLILWWRSRDNIDRVVAKIKARITGVQDE